MTEYHLDENLAAMANEVADKPDRFLHMHVRFGKKQIRTFEFPGDQTDLIEKITDIAKQGNMRVITQAIGTYTPDN